MSYENLTFNSIDEKSRTAKDLEQLCIKIEELSQSIERRSAKGYIATFTGIFFFALLLVVVMSISFFLQISPMFSSVLAITVVWMVILGVLFYHFDAHKRQLREKKTLLDLLQLAHEKIPLLEQEGHITSLYSTTTKIFLRKYDI